MRSSRLFEGRALISDLDDLPSGHVRTCHVCIVGAGPAGITLALDLMSAGLEIVLLESGGLTEESETQALNRGESVGHDMTPHFGRYRVFGGSATRWGGRCATLSEIDFSARDWVKHSGWPISLATLRPFYERAKRAGNFREPWIRDEDVPGLLSVRLPPFGSDTIDPHVWRYASPDTRQCGPPLLPVDYRPAFDWGRAYRNVLRQARNLQVVLHANVVGLLGGPSGRIDAVAVRSLAGTAMTVSAERVVLCCGGIENARLLLNVSPDLQRRINPHGVVGRYLSQHPRGCIGTVQADPATALRLQRTFTTFQRPRRIPVQYEIGLALSDRAQREHRLLNASVVLTYEAGTQSAWSSGRRIREAIKAGTPYPALPIDALRTLRGVTPLIGNAGRRFVLKRPLLHHQPIVRLVVDLEQEPNPDSRVTLAHAVDALGAPQVRLDWRLADIERRTARQFCTFIAEMFGRLGLGTVVPARWLDEQGPIGSTDLVGNYHFIGTTRMAEDPKFGVVDADCRVHGSDNLYVCGCSVFPTGGHANPTLTINALAIRLADHIRQRIREPSTVVLQDRRWTARVS